MQPQKKIDWLVFNDMEVNNIFITKATVCNAFSMLSSVMSLNYLHLKAQKLINAIYWNKLVVKCN